MAEPEHGCRHQDTLQGPTACYPAGKRVGAATDHEMQRGMLKARPRRLGLFICARQLQDPLATWHLSDAAGFKDSIGIPILRGASALVNTNGARSRRNSGTLKRTCIARAARSAAADRSAAPDISVKLVAGSHGTARNCSVTPDGRMDSNRPRFVRRRLAPSSIIAALSPGLHPVAEPHRDL